MTFPTRASNHPPRILRRARRILLSTSISIFHLSPLFVCDDGAGKDEGTADEGWRKLAPREEGGCQHEEGTSCGRAQEGPGGQAGCDAQSTWDIKIFTICSDFYIQGLSAKINRSVEQQMVNAASSGPLSIMKNVGDAYVSLFALDVRCILCSYVAGVHLPPRRRRNNIISSQCSQDASDSPTLSPRDEPWTPLSSMFDRATGSHALLHWRWCADDDGVPFCAFGAILPLLVLHNGAVTRKAVDICRAWSSRLTGTVRDVHITTLTHH